MRDYQAYLLRLQRHPERADWQVTLENVETRDRQQFASMEEAIRYVEEHLRRADDRQNDCHFDAL